MTRSRYFNNLKGVYNLSELVSVIGNDGYLPTKAGEEVYLIQYKDGVSFLTGQNGTLLPYTIMEISSTIVVLNDRNWTTLESLVTANLQ